LRALTEQLPRPVALAGGFEVPTGGSALSLLLTSSGVSFYCAVALQRLRLRIFVIGVTERTVYCSETLGVFILQVYST
jgi:hypothetical protein